MDYRRETRAIGAILWVVASGLFALTSKAESAEDLRRILAQAENIYQRHQTEALERYYSTAKHAKTLTELSGMPDEEVRAWGQLLFAAGERHKDFAEEELPEHPRVPYANKGQEIFEIYLSWYGKLSEPQRGVLKEVDRIYIVTGFIGQLFNDQSKHKETIERYEKLAVENIPWLGLSAANAWFEALQDHASPTVVANFPDHWQTYTKIVQNILDRPDSKLSVQQRDKLRRTLEKAPPAAEAQITSSANLRGERSGHRS